jgi:hypothetical protein
MRTESTPEAPGSDGDASDEVSPKRSLPESFVVALDELATKDAEDLSLILGLVSPDDDDEQDPDKDDD